MYRVELKESYFPAQMDSPILPTTVGGILRERAATAPDGDALIECTIDGQLGRRWTGSQLLVDVERLARALVTRYRPGERVCVWAPNVPEWVLLEFACGMAGLTLVTANPGYQARELRYVLEQSGSVGLFLVESYRGNPMARIAAEATAGNVRLREVVDVANQAALFAGAEAGAALPEVGPLDPVQIQYTSGTTGFPKGVVLHHQGITNNARLFCERLPPGHSYLNFMPLFHTAGCGMAVLGAMQSGRRLLLAALFDPDKMLDLVESERIDALLGVPTMFVALLDAQRRNPRDVSSLKAAASGGSMVPPELVRQTQPVFGVTIQTVYGQTESSPLLTMIYADDSFEDACETIGQAMPQTELAVLDPVTRAVTPLGVQGEICARGYPVMLGYNDNPEATAQAIDRDRWLHTGDLGTMDARGYLRITGRVKDMIIRGGENLFPAEIENVLLEHPDVAEVAVVGAPDDKWGEIVVAFIRSRTGAGLDRVALIAHCRQHLAAQKTPAHWIEVDAWPLTGSGKIQKFVLREGFVEGRYAPVAERAAQL